MNNHPIQDRLRDALAAHAQKFSASPDAWEHAQAKHARVSRHRRGRSGQPAAGWLARHRALVIPAAAAAAVAAVALSATALAHGFSGTRPTSPGLTLNQAIKSVSCAGTDQEQKGVPLPAGFAAQAAIRCIYTRREVPGQGVWQFQPTQVAYNALSQLTTALKRPSVTAPANTACAAPGIGVEPFVLWGSNGQVIAPRLPTTICGEPQQQALTALRALHWQTVATHNGILLETQQGLASGCPAAVKDMMGVLADIDHGRMLRPSGGGPVFSPQPPSLRVCEYRDRAEPLNPYLLGGGQVSGNHRDRAVARYCKRPRHHNLHAVANHLCSAARTPGARGLRRDRRVPPRPAAGQPDRSGKRRRIGDHKPGKPGIKFAGVICKLHLKAGIAPNAMSD